MTQPFSLAIWGTTGSAKSSIALSFPGPVVFDFDLRLGGVEKKLLDRIVRRTEGETGAYEYKAPVHIAKSGETRGTQIKWQLQGWREQYDQFVQDLLDELRKPDTLTIVIDTGTQMRETANNGYLQELQEHPSRPGELRQQLQQIEYAAPNDRIKSIYQAVKSARKNLVVTHYDEDEYKDDITFDPRTGEKEKVSVKTGHRVMKGFNKTPELVDMMLVTSLEQVAIYNNDGVKTGDRIAPIGTVTKAGLDLNMLGMRILDPNYDTIVQRLKFLRPGSW